MLWEMLYCIVFFILPLVGMFVAIGVRAFRGETEVWEDDEDVLPQDCVVGESGLVYTGRVGPHELFDSGALVIDLNTYRELGIIRVLKRRMYSRDGPGDTS